MQVLHYIFQFVDIDLEFIDQTLELMVVTTCASTFSTLITGSDFLAVLWFVVLLFLFMAPLYLLIALLIKLDSPGLFTSRSCIGLQWRPFGKVWSSALWSLMQKNFRKELVGVMRWKMGFCLKLKWSCITRVGSLRRYSLMSYRNSLYRPEMIYWSSPLTTLGDENSSEHHYLPWSSQFGITGLWRSPWSISDITDFEKSNTHWMHYYGGKLSLWLDLQILLQQLWWGKKRRLLNKGCPKEMQ